MAAFTTFTEAALARYLVMYGIGELENFRAIEGGIENSNYFVTTRQHDESREFVLTITEGLSFDEVPFFNDLFQKLSRSGLPVPNPQRTLDGMTSTIFCGKPTWLFPRLPGNHPLTVTTSQCETVGRALGNLHSAAEGLRFGRDNPYNIAWTEETIASRGSSLGRDDQAMLADFLAQYRQLPESLPTGIVHGDLFRDNVMFEGETLTGIIDFYHACTDLLAQDVAITINEWCNDGTGRIDEERQAALLSGYESFRPLGALEKDCMPVLQKNAAMRFVLTRLLSGDDDGHLKDPEEFLAIARCLQQR